MYDFRWVRLIEGQHCAVLAPFNWLLCARRSEIGISTQRKNQLVSYAVIDTAAYSSTFTICIGSKQPTLSPTQHPTEEPTGYPMRSPTQQPTVVPT